MPAVQVFEDHSPSTETARPQPAWLAAEPAALILQPTSLCNLDCTYCYLPARKLKRDMSPTVAEAIASGIPDTWPSDGVLEVVWHGGEPLTIGVTAMRELLAPFEQVRRAGRIMHVIQTNATLISDAWCDLFDEYDVSIGLSIDGPPDMTGNRVDWRGEPAFDRIVAGISKLEQRDIPFTVIAVVDTANAGRARELLDFLASLGCPFVGINMEEKEGANKHDGTPTIDQARGFWRETFIWSQGNRQLKVREVEHLLEYLALPPAARAARVLVDPIPTIGWNGDTVLLSPELLGARSEKYHDFVAGNVLTDPLPTIIGRAAELRYVQEFRAGIERCIATCEFFAHCQGAYAGNRFFEHGNFLATETEHCRTSVQAVVLALHDIHSERSIAV
ncbi:cyclophane-forming radical SAM peptide maturase AmcB [Kribbella sp.]|uniref:cyclophane-forming radical SAM peptide maturase AmcB n=1 Tax=Kribbella sp. TaxID=1871183 RepID=UPI002D49BED4|nr:cyclophane-forming radical SAM peptide maturase AmcB [Kribbella sp.]HZX08042.1 cyclophane-forming radical SAM peptide maturase AmcB [Kribbella sp.]